MSTKRMFFITHYQRKQCIAVWNIAEDIENDLNRGKLSLAAQVSIRVLSLVVTIFLPRS